MAFGKRKSGDKGDENTPGVESADVQAPVADDDLDGPFDIEDFDDAETALVGRHDLGAVLIPENEAAELAVEVNQQGVPTMAWMVTSHGRYNVTAYAAPKAGACGARWSPRWLIRCATNRQRSASRTGRGDVRSSGT